MHLKQALPVISAAVGIAIFSSQLAVAAQFQDVSSAHVNYDAIQFAQDAGIVSGYPDGTFKPDQTINRAEFVKIVVGFIYRGEEKYIEMCGGASGSYYDVPRGAWYGHFLCRARDDHIVAGYPDKTFRPEQPISFVEAAKIIAEGMTRIIDVSKYKSASDHTYDGRVFPEMNSNPWYERYVNWLATYKAIPLEIQSFDQQITRGQVAEMLYRLVERLSKDSQTYDSIGSASWFSEIDLCTDPPTRGSVISSDALVFPVKKEYLRLGYLGELLTAEDCGSARLKEFVGGKGDVDELSGNFPFIRLKEFATGDFYTWLEVTGFESKWAPAHASKDWGHPYKVKISTLLELRKYADLIEKFDCPNCYL